MVLQTNSLRWIKMKSWFFPIIAAISSLGNATASVLYVDVNSTNATPPYTNWATAAANIQDAADAAVLGDEIVVTNGVYATGGRALFGTMTNRVAVDKPLTIRSVNGPQVTIIRGYQLPATTNGDGAIRCVYLTNGASLSGFTLTRGATQVGWDPHPYRNSGGGVLCESGAVVSNCTLTYNSGYYGGGAYAGTLNNCTFSTNSASANGGGVMDANLNNCILIGNSAETYGGGAMSGNLSNCTLTANSAYGGGGANYAHLRVCKLTNNTASYSGGGCQAAYLNNCILSGNSAPYGGGSMLSVLNNCTLTANSATISGGGASGWFLNNCIVYFNAAPQGADCSAYYNTPITLEYSCTSLLPTNGPGNITNVPLFVNLNGGNLRLQSNSPCINAGRNIYASNPTDLDGNPRIVSGTVDMGAYEFQSPSSVVSYAWLQQYGLPTDGSADFTDVDGDGHNNWQEWRCRTNPTNALSALRLLPPALAGTNLSLSWQGVTGINYFLERSTNPASPFFISIVTNLFGQAGKMTFTETNVVVQPAQFYRVGVSD